MIFWRPGNLYCDRRRASRAVARSGNVVSNSLNAGRPGIHTRITSADTQDNLTDVNTGNGSVWLSPSTTHSSLQSIGTSARQHLVDTDNVEWVSTDTEMETFLSGDLDEVPDILLE